MDGQTHLNFSERKRVSELAVATTISRRQEASSPTLRPTGGNAVAFEGTEDPII